MMYCAQCGSKMTRHQHGAWVICCDGTGYWYNQGPTVEDARLAQPITHKGYWFYSTVNWPPFTTPTPPKLS